MARKVQPVTLGRDGQPVVADTAARETELRFEGYRSAPKEQPAPEGDAPESTETPAQNTPKPGAKSAPKN